MEQGLERRLVQGREEFLGMCVRMALARFGGDVSERVAALLLPVRSLGLLGQVGDILIETETGEEILTKLAGLAASTPANGASRA